MVSLLKIRYAAGWNMPGYLPEMEPAEFGSFEEAVRFLASEVERHWDDEYQDATAQEREEADERYLPLHTALHNASPAHDPGNLHFLQRCGAYTYWIDPAER